jgi:hypothetical protein
MGSNPTSRASASIESLHHARTFGPARNLLATRIGMSMSKDEAGPNRIRCINKYFSSKIARL